MLLYAQAAIPLLLYGKLLENKCNEIIGHFDYKSVLQVSTKKNG